MNRKILYGYQIQDGELTAHPKEAECVQRIFSLYLSGMAQHQIADTLNAEGLPYSAESPAWSRPRVMQTIRNSRYMGEKGYPTLVDDKTFFDEVRQRCRFKYWFFGHYHEDMVIEKKYVMLYEQIIRLKL